MGYAVSVRRDELALRLALGASPAALHRGVLRDAVWMAIGGGAAGIVASVWLLPPLRAMLYGVSAIDPLALGAAVAAMTIVALLAAAVPAWRASTVDPLSLLRR